MTKKGAVQVESLGGGVILSCSNVDEKSVNETKIFICDSCKQKSNLEPVYGKRTGNTVYGGHNTPPPIFFYVCSNCSAVICTDAEKYLAAKENIKT